MTEDETSTHEVASTTPPGKPGTPPAQTRETSAAVPGTPRSREADRVAAEGKPHQIKPDGR